MVWFCIFYSLIILFILEMLKIQKILNVENKLINRRIFFSFNLKCFYITRISQQRKVHFSFDNRKNKIVFGEDKLEFISKWWRDLFGWDWDFNVTMSKMSKCQNLKNRIKFERSNIFKIEHMRIGCANFAQHAQNFSKNLIFFYYPLL